MCDRIHQARSRIGEDAARVVQVTTQYFPQPPVMGVIPPTPACFVQW